MATKPDAREAERRLRAAEDRKRRASFGPPLALTDEALDQAATVREADRESALAFWRRVAPAGFRDLLDAEPVGPDG